MSRKFSKPPANNTRITNFFVAGHSNETTINEVKKANHIKEFYVECLESDHDQRCQRKMCADKKDELQIQLALDKTKLEQIKRAQATAVAICAEKDVEISILQRKLESAPSVCGQSSSPVQAKPFSKFT